MNNFCILRHGETPWNAELRLQGHLDIPLSNVGIQQAHDAAKQLLLSGRRATHIVSSDLLRASQTADILANWLGLTVVLDEGLRERDVGRLSGQTLPALQQDHPHDYRRYIEGCRRARFGNGETLVSFEQRVLTALQRHLQLQPPGKAVIFVCHEGVVRVVQDQLGRRQPVKNGEPHWFSCEINDLRLETAIA